MTYGTQNTSSGHSLAYAVIRVTISQVPRNFKIITNCDIITLLTLDKEVVCSVGARKVEKIKHAMSLRISVTLFHLQQREEELMLE
jgi:hypothetical protein